MERITHSGIILKRPYLTDRLRISLAEVPIGLSPIQAETKLVDLNTSLPQGFIFEKHIKDAKKGNQKIRVVKTTKPYNPDFITSAQTLTYLFPDSPSQAIITPLDGAGKTWTEFLRVNRQVMDVVTEIYKVRDVGDFLTASGINFSPYSNADFLRTQTIKAAHVHIFLISQKLLEQVSFFSSRRELRAMHEAAGTPDLDINRDLRRFFAGPIYRAFSSVALSLLERKLTTTKLGEFSQPQLFTNSDGNYPLSGITLTAKGTKILESSEFLNIIRDSYETLERFYKELLMPIFTSNYQEVISNESPEPKDLKYNDVDTTLAIYDEKITFGSFPNLTDRQKRNLRNLVRRIAIKLDKDKPESFSLGPAVAYTSLYDPKSNSTTLYITCSPFGGGSVESLGINKIPITQQEQDELIQRFYSYESMNIESELDNAIRLKLSRR